MRDEAKLRTLDPAANSACDENPCFASRSWSKRPTSDHQSVSWPPPRVNRNLRAFCVARNRHAYLVNHSFGPRNTHRLLCEDCLAPRFRAPPPPAVTQLAVSAAIQRQADSSSFPHPRREEVGKNILAVAFSTTMRAAAEWAIMQEAKQAAYLSPRNCRIYLTPRSRATRKSLSIGLCLPAVSRPPRVGNHILKIPRAKLLMHHDQAHRRILPPHARFPSAFRCRDC